MAFLVILIAQTVLVVQTLFMNLNYLCDIHFKPALDYLLTTLGAVETNFDIITFATGNCQLT